jgi:hypothetical protein
MYHNDRFQVGYKEELRCPAGVNDQDKIDGHK